MCSHLLEWSYEMRRKKNYLWKFRGVKKWEINYEGNYYFFKILTATTQDKKNIFIVKNSTKNQDFIHDLHLSNPSQSVNK